MDGFRRMFGSVASIRRITSLYPPYSSTIAEGPIIRGHGPLLRIVCVIL